MCYNLPCRFRPCCWGLLCGWDESGSLTDTTGWGGVYLYAYTEGNAPLCSSRPSVSVQYARPRPAPGRRHPPPPLPVCRSVFQPPLQTGRGRARWGVGPYCGWVLGLECNGQCEGEGSEVPKYPAGAVRRGGGAELLCWYVHASRQGALPHWSNPAGQWVTRGAIWRNISVRRAPPCSSYSDALGRVLLSRMCSPCHKQPPCSQLMTKEGLRGATRRYATLATRHAKCVDCMSKWRSDSVSVPPRRRQ